MVLLLICLSVIETDAGKDKLIDMYERLSSYIERRAERYAVGHRYNAEDLVQETWMRVSKRIDRLNFQNEDLEKIYLYTVLRSCAVEFWRKEKKRWAIESPLETIDEEPAESEEDPARLIGQLTTVEQIEGIAKALSQTDREILSLVLFSGWPIGEAARALNISRSAAEKRYQRAKSHLASKIREAGVRID